MADSVPDPAGLWLEWQNMVVPFLTGAGLKLPGRDGAVSESRNHHTDHLVDLLGELQEVARSDPEASW
jgi:1,2-phenylacetyl-CoA epoxidase catalytic subunit